MRFNHFPKTLQAMLAVFLFFAACQKEDIPPSGGEQQEENEQPGGQPEQKDDGLSEWTAVSSVDDFKALGSLKPGDRIVWEDGEYEAVKIEVNANGTESKPVMMRARTPGKVIFKGTSSITLKGSYIDLSGFVFKDLNTSRTDYQLNFYRGSSHCRIHDCMIDGTGTTPNADNNSKWVLMYGEYNELCNCTFWDKRDMGVMVTGFPEGNPLHHSIHNNLFYRPFSHTTSPGSASGINGQEIIRIGTSDVSMQTASCSVYANYFKECIGENSESISNKSCGNEYYGNLFEYCAGTMTLRHGNGCSVKSNYFLGGKSSYEGGVRVVGEDHTVQGNVFVNMTGSGSRAALCIMQGIVNSQLYEYFQVKNLTVKRNVFVDCKDAIHVNFAGTGATLAADGVSMDYNTVVCSSSSQSAVTLEKASECKISWTGNVIFGGSISGVVLPAAQERPSVPDYQSAMASIRKNAGVSWQ